MLHHLTLEERDRIVQLRLQGDGRRGDRPGVESQPQHDQPVSVRVLLMLRQIRNPGLDTTAAIRPSFVKALPGVDRNIDCSARATEKTR